MKRKTTPEQTMKLAFASLFKLRKQLEIASASYADRNDEVKADEENCVNVKAAISFIDRAYDEISAIWENDINV